MNHILITTALQAEAKSIVNYYQLEKQQHSKKIFFFQNGEISCLTTGVGGKNVNSRLKEFLEMKDCRRTILLNIGTAGGSQPETEIGQMYLVNKITSANNGRVWLPDIVLKTGLPELQLTTVKKGITDGGKQFQGLVDMEGAAIFETAIKFIPAHRLFFLKIVSDHMNVVLDSQEHVLQIMKKQLPEIDRIIGLLNKAEIIKAPLLNDQQEILLKELTESLRLTTTQVFKLRNKLKGFIVIQHDEPSFLSSYLDSEINSKQDQRKVFHEICTRLSA